MTKTTLSDISNEPSEITLTYRLPKGDVTRHFQLRKHTMMDENWVILEFGVGGLAKLLSGEDPNALRSIIKLLYRMFPIEEKKFLASIEIEEEDMDEDGNMIKYENAIDKLLFIIDSGKLVEMFETLANNRNNALPNLTEEDKKKASKLRKTIGAKRSI